MINVYENENCRQCEATKFLLNKHNVNYITAMLSDNPDVVEFARDNGWTTAPVVLVTDNDGGVVDSWSGLQPSKIKQYR